MSLLDIEICVVIFTGITSLIFWKGRNENKVYKTIFNISWVIFVIDMLLMAKTFVSP